MGTKYETQTLTGYNSSPPSDDGSSTESNKVYWATIKSKLPDPLKAQIAAIDTALVDFVDTGPIAKSTAYTTTAADHLKTIECNGTFTVTLAAVASVYAGYAIRVINVGTGIITVDGSTTETINGELTYTLTSQYDAVTVQVNNSGAAYIILDRIIAKTSKGADIASANDLDLTANDTYNDVTGTTDINGLTDGVAGDVRKLHADAAVTFKHDTAPSAGYSKIWVTNGEADYTTAANEEIEFIYDGTYWRITNILKTYRPGELVPLETQTALVASTATLTLSEVLGSTYDEYVIKYDNIYASVSGEEILMQVTDGVSFKTAGYHYVIIGNDSSGASVDAASTNYTGGVIASGLRTDSVLPGKGEISIMGHTTSQRAAWDGHGVSAKDDAGVSLKRYIFSARYDTNIIITGIRFTVATGFFNGTFRLYGRYK